MSAWVQVQKAIEKAIASISDSTGDKPIAIIAEFPAHLPAIIADEAILVRALGSLLSQVIGRTARTEVRVRAQIAPGGSPSLDHLLQSELSTETANTAPWMLLSISDIEAPFAESEEVSDQGREAALEPVEFMLEECREVIERFHGHLWAEATRGSGIRLWIAMPLRAAIEPRTDISEIRRAVETHIPEGSQTANSLLIFVEDTGLRNLLSSELVGAGYRVLVSANAEDVITLAITDTPDLIILDLDARAPSAFDLATLLKGDRRIQEIPILFLTTYPGPEGEVQMGTASFLFRAEGTGALLATIHSALHGGSHPASRVLIVEPDDVLRENMILRIQAFGYPVVEARSAGEAVALAERVRIGLVLTDARLAQERDYWLIKQLRQIPEEMEIYVIADALTDEEGQAAISRGASGYGETGKLGDLFDRVKGENEKQ
ncbi:MAG TPA: response regulator [Anaerolineales bacterium]|nr:response regulator [Anaerolineales bacterium]